MAMTLLMESSMDLQCITGSYAMLCQVLHRFFQFFMFILSHVYVPPKKLVALMEFCCPLYSQPDYLNIVKYKHSISMYSMCMNGYTARNFNRKNMLYIDGRPQTHGNITMFINRSRS